MSIFLKHINDRKCATHGMQRVLIEGDALSIVAALRKLGQCWSSYGHLIEDTRVLLERVQPLDIGK
jgi:hypothetical protein